MSKRDSPNPFESDSDSEDDLELLREAHARQIKNRQRLLANTAKAMQSARKLPNDLIAVRNAVSEHPSTRSTIDSFETAVTDIVVNGKPGAADWEALWPQFDQLNCAITPNKADPARKSLIRISDVVQFYHLKETNSSSCSHVDMFGDSSEPESDSDSVPEKEKNKRSVGDLFGDDSDSSDSDLKRGKTNAN
jgi:hypothetical protein